MKACVCDKCGKVVLFSDEIEFIPEGICRLSDGRSRGLCLDLCTECVGQLMEAVRETKGESK